MGYIFVYVTTSSLLEARKIAKGLLEKKLIGCANFLPIQSMYRWQGKINVDREVGMILKTREDMLDKVKEEVAKRHSYLIPCITSFSVVPNTKYAAWLDEQMK